MPKGGRLIGLGSGCPYYTKSYLGNVCDTYYGEALAIVKPIEGEKKIRLSAATVDGKLTAEAEVEVI